MKGLRYSVSQWEGTSAEGSEVVTGATGTYSK